MKWPQRERGTNAAHIVNYRPALATELPISWAFLFSMRVFGYSPTFALALISYGFLEHKVILTTPNFRYETETSLNDSLISLGMTDAFSENADFSGLVQKQPGQKIYLSDVLHKAFIEVPVPTLF